MVTEPGPESCLKNRVDIKKLNCMLVDKKVSVEKQQQQQQQQQKQTKNKTAVAVANLVTCVWHSQRNQTTDLTSSHC